ncbi:hypothetical protein MasN3_25630 [Massilia varians]|uniref:Ice-binding protein C-terminal domain-containing protein n=1 Tax=Massilia varians TaxID=457921 RepID=A0ABM8C739_9BURK|nr:PEP-CTERM sorting domain-containing protein [Massilia varians]BDT59069.1 hypothetical protein MasN3_25630 [Massilia varians]
MDRSYPSSRRSLLRTRRHTRVALAGGAALLGAIVVSIFTWEPEPIAANVPAAYTATLALNAAPGSTEPVQRGVRRIYPYSVVPGGVADQAELQRVIRTDRVVAAHYASFDAAKARPTVVDKPRAVHVSYRKGDKVYWTAHKVMLSPGETLLNDGRNEMRARCANRISDLPQYPVEAHRPAMEELDQPIELAEGEQYALVSSGLPETIHAASSMQHHFAPGAPVQQASAARSAARTATAPLLADTGFDIRNMGPVSTVNLLGFVGGTDNSPVSEPAAPEPDPAAGTGASGGESSSPSPGGSPPGEGPADTGPVTGPAPGAAPAPTPLPGGESPLPTPGPGVDPAPGPVTEPQPPRPGPAPPSQPAPEPAPGQPKPEPLPPQTVVPAAPAEVPEPGSLWLFALALAAMAGLRRRRGA